MATQPLDAGGESRAALRAIVNDHGAAALSNPQLMNSLLNDLMPDSPRESSVLVAAAGANVAGIMQERAAQHFSTAAAIAQAAAALEERTALAPDACQWAARQLAEALDLPQETGPLPGPGPVPGPGPGTGATAPHQRARKHAPAASRVAVGAAAAIVVIYLVIAGTAHLPPFGKSASSGHGSALSSPSQTASPGPSSSQTLSPSPSPSRTGFQPTARDSALFSLIPAKVQGTNNCAAVRPRFGAIAQVNCSGAAGIPPSFVTYYQFTRSATMNSAYRQFLTLFAHTSESAPACGNFTVFMPRCEDPYQDVKTRKSRGRVVEYSYKGTPDMSFTAKSKKLLIDMGGPNGNALTKWWIKPTRYVVGGI